MIRCVALAVALFASALPACAQAPRNFPATALRGEIIITQPPELLLNGRPARLAPGARIRDQNNMGLVSGAILSQRLDVNYTLDLSGSLLNVWVLTAQERAKQPWPRTPEQAAAWQFDAGAQTWSRP